MDFFITVLLIVLLFAFFRFTLLGKSIRACADNYEGARVVGLNVKRLYAFTFGLGAACVGAAGAMMMVVIDVTPNIGPAYTLLAFVIVYFAVFGVGIGSLSYALALAVRKQDWMFWVVQQTLIFPLMILSALRGAPLASKLRAWTRAPRTAIQSCAIPV